MELKKLPGAWVMEAFRRGGVDLDTLNQRLPDDVNLMLHEMDTISPDSISRLLQSCADISGEQDFGLIMNELVDMTMYGLLGYLLINSSTVGDLFETLVRYHSVHHDGGVLYKLDIQQDTVAIQVYYAQQSELCHRHITEWCLGFIPYYLKNTLQQRATPLRAEFTHKAPRSLQTLRDYFGSDIVFKQAHNQLIYPRSILQQRITEVDSHLLGILRERADKLLLTQKKDDSLLNQIKTILFENLNNNKVNATDIAATLNLSISTFKRKMSKEGINFNHVKASIKNELAKQLLSHTSVKIYEVALKTGFTNQSSFTRFFIRCNQQTPLSYRQSKNAPKSKF